MLTDILERILRWKQKHFPLQVPLLQPGLSDTEINQITQDWPIQPPTEVRELYKWRNGSTQDDIGLYAYIFDGFTFLPLQEIKVEYQSGTEENRCKYPNDFFPNSLNIFLTPEPDTGYIIISEEGEIERIEFGYWTDGCWICEMYYTSLTNMMLTLAEYREGNEYIGSIWYASKENRNKCIQIWCKYNSFEFDYAEIEELLSKPSWESISRVVTDLIKFRNPKKSEFLARIVQKISTNTEDYAIQELAAKLLYQENDCQRIGLSIKKLENEYWQTRPTTRLSLYYKRLIAVEDDERDCFIDALESSDAIIKRTMAFLLFMLNAVEPLIQSLKNKDADIRKESVWALGQIGDSKAAQPIIEALLDSDSEVREAAREAWDKLTLKSPQLNDIIPF